MTTLRRWGVCVVAGALFVGLGSCTSGGEALQTGGDELACAWSENESRNNPIADSYSPGGVLQLAVEGDGRGGTLVAWVEESTVLAQRLDAAGLPLWRKEGVRVVTSDLHPPRDVGIAPDENGGAIVMWSEDRYGVKELVVRRLDPEGKAIWEQDLVIGEARGHVWAQLLFDWYGGFFLFWLEPGLNLFALRIDLKGQRTWDSGDLLLGARLVEPPKIASDYTGGMLLATRHERTVSLQRLDPRGWRRWEYEALLLDTRVFHEDDTGRVRLVGVLDELAIDEYETHFQEQFHPSRRVFGDELELVDDGEGGAILVYRTQQALRALRVDSEGVLEWRPGLNLLVGKVAQLRASPQILRAETDLRGGVLVAWVDTLENSIQVQRLDEYGQVAWSPDPLRVRRGVLNLQELATEEDDDGGFTLVWTEELDQSTGTDVYAQRIGSEGAPYWSGDGLAVSTAHRDQFDLRVVGDEGSAVVVWCDRRNAEDPDVFGQRITAGGDLGCSSRR